MPLEFIYLNSPPVVVVNCDNGKAMGIEKLRKVKFKKSTKNDSIEFREQNTEKQNKTKNKKNNKNKQTNKQKRQNGNQVLNQQTAKM